MMESGVDDKVRVELGARSYDILIGPGLLAKVGDLTASVLPATQGAVIITNPAIARLYGGTVERGLRSAGFKVTTLEAPAGERAKSLAAANKIYGRLLELGADRQTVILALGGGVIGDLAGFIAATYMRGVPYIQLPTTLLAQVDSSIGGKTAVDHALAKNTIGAFYQPKSVIIDPLVLETLPPRELRTGLSEVIKYALISGEPLLSRVRELLSLDLGGHNERTRPKAPDARLTKPEARERIHDYVTEPKARKTQQTGFSGALLAGIIADCCRYKAEVVAGDERDLGRRAVLNYGHTIGHAIEVAAGYRRYNHGEAVAVGMIGAARIAQAKGWLKPADVRLHQELIRAAGLPSTTVKVAAAEIYKHLKHDKKREQGSDRLVLLKGLGRPVVAPVEPNLIKKTIAGLSGGVK
ncbi:MAG: 3-dehydroquinate synthase [Actinomycetota bacterium]|nr:3-dehydroquinate synthase [Actinomycetota bacterium]